LPVYRNDLDSSHILEKLKNTIEIALNENLNLKTQQNNNISFTLPRNNSRGKQEKIFEERSLTKKKSGTFNIDDISKNQRSLSNTHTLNEVPSVPVGMPLTRNRS
jgi:hypothetical protein